MNLKAASSFVNARMNYKPPNSRYGAVGFKRPSNETQIPNLG